MTAVINKLLNSAAALAIAVIASASGALDELTQRTGLSATVLLLITLAVVFGLALAFMAVAGYLSMREVADSETYRTASKTTMQADIRKARSLVPHAVPRSPVELAANHAPGALGAHINTSRRHTVIDRSELFRQTAESVRAAGKKAADHDFDTGFTTINPHQPATRWAVLWMTSREARLMERQAERAGALTAVHTNTHVGA
ncbi:MAG: hypothetical protein V4706_02715 [Pseudomonadota bacterium]